MHELGPSAIPDDLDFDVHLGTHGCKSRFFCSISCAATRLEQSISSAISSTAGGCANRGTGRKPTMTWCRNCCARCATGTRVVYVRGITMNGCAITQGCASAASRWSRRQSTSPPMDAIADHPRRFLRPGGQACPLAGGPRDGAYTLALWANHHFKKCAAFSATTTGPFQLS